MLYLPSFVALYVDTACNPLLTCYIYTGTSYLLYLHYNRIRLLSWNNWRAGGWLEFSVHFSTNTAISQTKDGWSNFCQVVISGADDLVHFLITKLWTNNSCWYCIQGCKRDLSLRDRDETETFGFWSETRPRPRPSCNSTRPRRDRDVWFLPRDETETLQGRDRDVFQDLQPSALCHNNEWRTCLCWCHKQLSHCNCNVHYNEIYSPHKH